MQIERLHERLLAAAALLDAAAGEIRDIPLDPPTENVRRIGIALAEIFDILRAIYAVRPDLAPPQVEIAPEESAGNKRLTVALGEAYRLAAENRLSEAIAGLKSFCDVEPSQFHRQIAKHELQRLEDRIDR